MMVIVDYISLSSLGQNHLLYRKKMVYGKHAHPRNDKRVVYNSIKAGVWKIHKVTCALTF